MEILKLRRVVFWLTLLLSVSIAHAQTTYVTRTGKKYHRDDCQYLKYSKIVMELKEAKKLFTPCSVCKPSTQVSESSNGNPPPTRVNRETQSSQTPTDTQSSETPSPTYEQTRTSSSQCTGTTKTGARCKRMTTSATGRCYQH